MDDNKAIVIVIVGMLAFGMIATSIGVFSESNTEIEKERTKQLELKYKLDSLNHSKMIKNEN